jgi:hypothetical protein
MGVEALPLSHAITVTGEVGFLAWFLRDRVAGRGLVKQHVKIAVAAVALGIVAWLTRDHLHVVLICAVSGVAYLAVAVPTGALNLGFLRGLRRDPGLPPSVNVETEAALRALARGASLADVDGVVQIVAAQTWVLSGDDGQLVARELRELPPVEPAPGPLSQVQVILRPGRPPRVVGLVVTTAQGERAWHVEGDALVAGAVAGPRIKVG